MGALRRLSVPPPSIEEVGLTLTKVDPEVHSVLYVDPVATRADGSPNLPDVTRVLRYVAGHRGSGGAVLNPGMVGAESGAAMLQIGPDVFPVNTTPPPQRAKKDTHEPRDQHHLRHLPR